jgi:sec-independent protein translocase protein TatC
MVVGSGISFIFAQQIITLLAVPVGGVDKLVAIEVTESLGVFMRVSLLSGFIIALPVILSQIIAFLSPGLMPSERRWLNIFIPFATLLFIGGVAFNFFIMLPAALPFLIEFLGIKTTPRLSNYIEFVTGFMFWVGISFELPLLMYILARLRFVSARMLLRGWRYALVIIAVASALITPTGDPINMGLMMLPLVVLYLLSIVLAAFARRGESS